MALKNDLEVKQKFYEVLQKVTQEMADYIVDKIKDYILEDVYYKYQPSMYLRSDNNENFLNSWISEVEKDGRSREVVATIFSEPSLMSVDLDYGRHGSKEYGDIRDKMAMAIQEGILWTWKERRSGMGYDWRNPASVKRPFFDDTIKYLNRNGNLMKVFEQKMAKRGFIVTRGK